MLYVCLLHLSEIVGSFVSEGLFNGNYLGSNYFGRFCTPENIVNVCVRVQAERTAHQWSPEESARPIGTVDEVQSL